MKLTHINEKHNPKMVDVGEKDITKRVAVASGKIRMKKETLNAILEEKTKKGAVLQTAIIAAIMGSKKTSELIPMCHNILIDGVDVDIEVLEDGFKLIVTAKTTSKTGIEMEALTAVSIGLLTIYDMAKAIDRGMEIYDIRLEMKNKKIPCFILAGGKSSRFGTEKDDKAYLFYDLQYSKCKKIFKYAYFAAKKKKFKKYPFYLEKSKIYAPIFVLEELIKKYKKIFVLSIDTPFIKPVTLKKLLLNKATAKNNPLIGFYDYTMLKKLKENKKTNLKISGINKKRIKINKNELININTLEDLQINIPYKIRQRFKRNIY